MRLDDSLDAFAPLHGLSGMEAAWKPLESILCILMRANTGVVGGCSAICGINLEVE